MTRPHEARAAFIRAEAARLAALCTACGACARACPMVPHVPAMAGADPVAVTQGMRDIAQGGHGSPAALAWVAACGRSGRCRDACPEGLPADVLVRLAGMRAKGALGDAPLVPVVEDTQYAPKVKAFARLTLTEEEQRQWL